MRTAPLHKMPSMTTPLEHGHYTYRYPNGYQHFLWYRTEEDAHQAAGDQEHEIVASTCDPTDGKCMSFTLPGQS